MSDATFAANSAGEVGEVTAGDEIGARAAGADGLAVGTGGGGAGI